jgi:hypothetical protein
MLSFLPCLECLLHEMAGHAELRIFLGIPVITVRQDATNRRDQEKQNHDGFLVFFDKTDEGRGLFRHVLTSLPAEEFEEFVEEK